MAWMEAGVPVLLFRTPQKALDFRGFFPGSHRYSDVRRVGGFDRTALFPIVVPMDQVELVDRQIPYDGRLAGLYRVMNHSQDIDLLLRQNMLSAGDARNIGRSIRHAPRQRRRRSSSRTSIALASHIQGKCKSETRRPSIP